MFDEFIYEVYYMNVLGDDLICLSWLLIWMRDFIVVLFKLFKKILRI